MRRRGPALLALAFLLAACVSPGAAPAGSPTVAPPHAFTVGLVTDIGGLHDRSYNQLANLGLRDARMRYGVKTAIIQSSSERQYVANLTTLARRHTDLIVGVGFTMSGAVYAVASAYPQERFALVDAQPTDSTGAVHLLPNVTDLLFQAQQSGYLAGVVAGLMEKDRVGAARHNAIGFLGGEDIPPVASYLAGYVAGARSVDPHIRIHGQFAGTFTDGSVGRTIGDRQVASGADILFQVAAATGRGYLDAAQAHHVYGIGADADQSYLGSFVITSAVKKVDVAVADLVGLTLHGRYRGGDLRLGLSQGATGIAAPSSIVPPAIVRTVARDARAIERGAVRPPTTLSAGSYGSYG